MDKNEYWRKKMAESKDHAADGKKSFKLSAAHKKDIVIRDLGSLAMAEADVSTSQILATILTITDDDLEAAGKISTEQLAALYELFLFWCTFPYLPNQIDGRAISTG